MCIPQCTSDEDMTKYKQILRQWINTQPLEYGLIYRGTTDYKWPPYSHRYLAMAYINHYFMTEPSGHIGIALLPETAFDARETALWLSELLHRIHKEVSYIIIDLDEILRFIYWSLYRNTFKSTTHSYKNGRPGLLGIMSLWTGWMIFPTLAGIYDVVVSRNGP